MTLSDADKTYIAQQNLDIARQLLAAIDASADRRVMSLTNQLADLRALMIDKMAPPNVIRLETAFPVAYKSNDHTSPRGTKDDNTRSPRFCRAVETHFGRAVTALDLGCAGGGLVFDFLIRGNRAFGLEGSDFPYRTQRAEWRVIGDYLQTCDITKPFRLIGDDNAIQRFDVITMWEVLEHIQDADLPQLFANVKMHLAADGLYVGSAATYDDVANGVSYHPTVQPESWWRSKALEHGLAFVEASMFGFGDYCRGSGNTLSFYDADFSKNPELGFHFVMRHAG